MPREQLQVTSFRLPPAMLEQLDQYAEQLGAEHPGMTYSRTDVARQFLAEGLAKHLTKRAPTAPKFLPMASTADLDRELARAGQAPRGSRESNEEVRYRLTTPELAKPAKGVPKARRPRTPTRRTRKKDAA